MLALGPGARLYFYTEPCDMRKGYAGLGGLVRAALGRDPADGAVYCFVNRRRDRIKLLLFEGDGFAVYYKVLPEGTLEVPAATLAPGPDGTAVPAAAISAQTLHLILSGVHLRSVKRRKRYGREGAGEDPASA